MLKPEANPTPEGASPATAHWGGVRARRTLNIQKQPHPTPALLIPKGVIREP